MNDEQRRAEVDHNYDIFMRQLGDLLPDHRDEYALMRGGKIVGFFKKPGDGYREGIARFEDRIFSLQEVTDEPLDLGFWSRVALH